MWLRRDDQPRALGRQAFPGEDPGSEPWGMLPRNRCAAALRRANRNRRARQGRFVPRRWRGEGGSERPEKLRSIRLFDFQRTRNARELYCAVAGSDEHAQTCGPRKKPVADKAAYFGL